MAAGIRALFLTAVVFTAQASIAEARERIVLQGKTPADLVCQTNDECVASQMMAQFAAMNKSSLERESRIQARKDSTTSHEVVMGGPGAENLPCVPFPKVSAACVSRKCVLIVEGEKKPLSFYECYAIDHPKK